VLGYLNPEVEEAVARQHAMVDCGPGAGPVMVDLAEKIVSLVDEGAWALFAKNGADVTTLSVTLARAHTGKRTVLVANGAYHGSLPWCNPDVQGTVPGDRQNLDYFDFNDLGSVAAALERHQGDLAAVILSPYRQPPGFDQEAPTAEFAVGLRELCDKNDALLIHDEVRTGMRIELGTSWRQFGVAPDMSAWGKAIANGYALSALVGKEEVREAAAKVFATGSFWWTGDAMAAGLATLEIMERDDSLAAMNAWGRASRRASPPPPRRAASRSWSPGRRRCPTPASRPTTTIAASLTSSRPRAASTGCTSTPGTIGSFPRRWMSATLTRHSPRSRLVSMPWPRKRTSVDRG